MRLTTKNGLREKTTPTMMPSHRSPPPFPHSVAAAVSPAALGRQRRFSLPRLPRRSFRLLSPSPSRTERAKKMSRSSCCGGCPRENPRPKPLTASVPWKRRRRASERLGEGRPLPPRQTGGMDLRCEGIYLVFSITPMRRESSTLCCHIFFGCFLVALSDERSSFRPLTDPRECRRGARRGA